MGKRKVQRERCEHGSFIPCVAERDEDDAYHAIVVCCACGEVLDVGHFRTLGRSSWQIVKIRPSNGEGARYRILGPRTDELDSAIRICLVEERDRDCARIDAFYAMMEREVYLSNAHLDTDEGRAKRQAACEREKEKTRAHFNEMAKNWAFRVERFD